MRKSPLLFNRTHTKHCALFGLVASLLFAQQALASKEGEDLFNQRCVACHQAGGIGAPGLAPPLVNAALWPALKEQAQPYFFGVLTSGLSGTIEVDGVGYYGLVMPPQADLSEAQMTALADYVLNDLNGLGITPDAKALSAARTQPSPHSALRELRKHAQ